MKKILMLAMLISVPAMAHSQDIFTYEDQKSDQIVIIVGPAAETLFKTLTDVKATSDGTPNGVDETESRIGYGIACSHFLHDSAINKFQCRLNVLKDGTVKVKSWDEHRAQ